MELDKVSLEQWQDIENLIQLVETYGLLKRCPFNLLEESRMFSKVYEDATDLYNDCEKIVSIVKEGEPKEIDMFDFLKYLKNLWPVPPNL